jgi:hypothetical protein
LHTIYVNYLMWSSKMSVCLLFDITQISGAGHFAHYTIFR